MSETDFWWIQGQQCRSIHVGVGHHQPLAADANRFSVQWDHSLENGQGSLTEKLHPLGFISRWRETWNDTNVYRTLTLFDKKGNASLLGPFLIDIDNRGDLEHALQVTRRTTVILGERFGVGPNDLQVFFSGRKGFNIEVRPSTVGISGTVDDQISVSGGRLDEIIVALRQYAGTRDEKLNAVDDHGTYIDRIYGNHWGWDLRHEYIRLHGSINSWVDKDSNRMARRKIRLTLAEIDCMTSADIYGKAECNV